MPQYDESFIFDDSANQRRNKRSYRVSRKGLLPIFNKSAEAASPGTYVLKNNINNLKRNKDYGSNHALKGNGYNEIYPKSINKSFPSLLDPYNIPGDEKIVYRPSSDIYAIKNNNYYSFVVGKSLEDLASNGHYSPLKNCNGLQFCNGKGKSLQNLNENINVPLISKHYNKSTTGYLNKSKESILNNCNHYIVNDTAKPEKKSKRLYETNAKLKEKAALKLAARILESGVYRQLGKTRCEENEDSGFVDDHDGIEVVEGSAVGGAVGSGHKASFRSANKLARRARSFKDDFLERISAMRSPGAPASNSTLPSLRSQSPLSPKNRSPHKGDDSTSNPAKDLEALFKRIKFELRHFRDVIKKNKLEMLPGNGTIVLETVMNIHGVVKPYVSPLMEDSLSAHLDKALNNLCTISAELIQFCDESMVAGEDSNSMNTKRIFEIVDEVQLAVDELSALAFDKISGVDHVSHVKSNRSADKEMKNKSVKPIVDNIRNSTSENQRNSLPDIPLTPRDREMLEAAGNRIPVRSSHSTESILDTIPNNSKQEPPPKPPIPTKNFQVAPPLPPKRRPIENLGLSTMDRVSLQSHSTDSLDSMLNASNDEEIRAIMDGNSSNFDDSLQHINSVGMRNCPNRTNNRLSLESTSTICTTSSGSTHNRNSDEIIPHNSLALNNTFGNESLEVPNNSHNRLSNESGFISMGNIRNSEISCSSFSTNVQYHKANLAFIDSTPTPVDMPTLLTDFSNDKNQLFISNPAFDMSNVVQSMQQVSSNFNFVEQSSKTVSFSHSSVTSSNQVSSFGLQNCTTKVETVQNSHKSQMNFVQSSAYQDNSVKVSMNGSTSMDEGDGTVPPALPVKTRKLTKSDLTENLSEHGMTPFFDDQYVEFRQHPLCALHGQDGPLQRPHTLADQSQPPPLPMKKKHMFQSVAYSVMAYMEMFGNYSRTPQIHGEMLRHSLHEQHHHSGNHCMQSIQHSNASLESDGQSVFSKNSQMIHGFSHNSHLMGNKCNSQLTQSHTLHQFNVSNTSQSTLSSFSSPIRSPHLSREDSSISDATLSITMGTNNAIPQISPSSNNMIPPALPPKRTKLKPTPNHSPAKPPISPKPASIQAGSASPTTPVPLNCGTPLSGRASTSPIPKLQFDPPPLVIDDALLLNPEDERWQQSPNKPGKFPIEDLDLVPNTSVTPSPSPRDSEPLVENDETEPELDILLEMDVSSKLVWKPSSEEDGPDIRGGHPDALIVQAIKSTKDFSEAFLTTYRTFITPSELIEKLMKRHAYLMRHGQYSKSREVQSLFTRVVVDLTTSDLTENLLSIILNFNYDLVRSGDLQMAKTLRVIILKKLDEKRALSQQQPSEWFKTPLVRKESILDQKPEAIAEQMTLLDAKLFIKIPIPEALLWAQDQSEERSPNLTRFTEHFNKMSYWARSRVLEQQETKDREKYVSKFLKVMKCLRKMNNFNSYLALLSALVCAPISRLDWPKYVTDSIKEYNTLIDNTASFRAYRQALLEVQPPCIPYLGLVLQDLTFVHIGNNNFLPDGSINFSKRWQQFRILENMKRFSKAKYTFKRNDKIISMFDGFDDYFDEETTWKISESIKPRSSKKNAS